ncbi:hypothetical protein GC170_20775 [bacterium]|nr:hypothetical protein [bacterium]
MSEEKKRPQAAARVGGGLFVCIIGGILLGAMTGKMGLCLAAGIFFGLVTGGGAAMAGKRQPKG